MNSEDYVNKFYQLEEFWCFGEDVFYKKVDKRKKRD
jgi:hypothetical protein